MDKMHIIFYNCLHVNSFMHGVGHAVASTFNKECSLYWGPGKRLSDSRRSFILLLNLLSMASDAIAQWTKEDKSRKTIVEENWGPRSLHLLVFVSVRCSIWLCCAWHCEYIYRVYLVLVYDYISSISHSLGLWADIVVCIYLGRKLGPSRPVGSQYESMPTVAGRRLHSPMS